MVVGGVCSTIGFVEFNRFCFVLFFVWCCVVFLLFVLVLFVCVRGWGGGGYSAVLLLHLSRVLEFGVNERMLFDLPTCGNV